MVQAAALHGPNARPAIITAANEAMDLTAHQLLTVRQSSQSSHSSANSSASARSRSPKKSRVTRTVDVSSYSMRRNPLSSSS
jgi:hypothetical protein